MQKSIASVALPPSKKADPFSQLQKELKLYETTGVQTLNLTKLDNGLYDKSSLMIVKTDIIIIEFTIMSSKMSKIEKFEKDIFIPDDKFGFDLQTVQYTRFAKSSLGLDSLMTKNVPYVSPIFTIFSNYFIKLYENRF
jgi:hypothetical protein